MKFPICTFKIIYFSVLLVDPTLEEEAISDGILTVVSGKNKELFVINKPGIDT